MLLPLVGSLIVAATETPPPSLSLVQTIPLPNVTGRIDHLAWDRAAERLFVAALGHNSVEVVDLRTGRVARSLLGFSEPQGLLYLPEFRRLYVANGGDGTLRVLDTTGFAAVATVKFDDDADNIRYDAVAKRVYVGYGSGALGIVDATTNLSLGSIPLTAHPESFQLEKNGTRIFVNVPRAHAVAVVDRSSRRLVQTWPLNRAAGNFPMALDDTNRRAFLACRAPSLLLVRDLVSGNEIAQLELHGDCDDVFYDSGRHRVYASCGAGYIDVFTQMDADHYVLRETLSTAPGARTCLYADDRLVVAVPQHGQADAQLRIYRIE